MSIILTLIMGVSIGFVIAAITMANKVAEYEEEIAARAFKIYELQCKVDNRDILIKDMQEENTKLKSELADRKSH